MYIANLKCVSVLSQFDMLHFLVVAGTRTSKTAPDCINIADLRESPGNQSIDKVCVSYDEQKIKDLHSQTTLQSAWRPED